MTQTATRPPRTILEVWESLPEGTLCELINNQLIMSPSPQNIHQVILNEINIEVSLYLRKNKIGEIRIAPFDVHFSSENILQPDLLFIENKNLDKIRKNGFYGAPDLIIEILSPSSLKIDYKDKKSVYEKFGVQEYFIVDPDSKKVDSFFIKNGKYEEQKAVTGKINSKILATKISF